MSKAAVYAGLGQGLMSLGQGVSRAIETMSIEQMRQQNLEQNWAREDRIRSQDMSIRKAERAEDAQFKDRTISAQEQNNQALMDLRRDEVTDKKEQRPVKDDIVTDNGFDYRVQYNKEGKEIKREIVATQNSFKENDKLPEATKVQLRILETELKSLIEMGDNESSRAGEIRRDINSLLGVKQSEMMSGVDGLTAEEVIEKFKTTNPSLGREQIIQLAKSKGYLK